MDKKKYTTPDFEELGDLVDITKNSWTGSNFDGALPEETPEVFGS